jgi:hypothetical protein
VGPHQPPQHACAACCALPPPPPSHTPHTPSHPLACHQMWMSWRARMATCLPARQHACRCWCWTVRGARARVCVCARVCCLCARVCCLCARVCVRATEAAAAGRDGVAAHAAPHGHTRNAGVVLFPGCQLPLLLSTPQEHQLLARAMSAAPPLTRLLAVLPGWGGAACVCVCECSGACVSPLACVVLQLRRAHHAHRRPPTPTAAHQTR